MYLFFFCLLHMLFSHSVVSESLQPHGLQHARLPCTLPSPGACLNSCPLIHYCHSTISSSVIPFSSCDIIWYLSFSVYITSLNMEIMIISRSLHTAANDIIPLLLMAIIPLYIYVPHLLYPFFCQWIHRFLHVLAIVVNNAIILGCIYPFFS